MTLGSGIFSSTLLLIIVFALWQISKHRKWKTIGKIAVFLLTGGTLLGLAIWGWNIYANRPRVQNELDGVALGATPLDVQLKKGKPNRKFGNEDGSKYVRWIFLDDPEREDESTSVLSVSVVCRKSDYVSLLGFSNYANETDIIEKLGKPTYTSIRADGLAKTISFEQWRAAFEFKKGNMTVVCVSNSGKVRYAKEHGDKLSEDSGESK